MGDLKFLFIQICRGLIEQTPNILLVSFVVCHSADFDPTMTSFPPSPTRCGTGPRTRCLRVNSESSWPMHGFMCLEWKLSEHVAAGIVGLGLGWMLLWVIFEKCIGTGMVFLNMIFCGTWVCKTDVFFWVGLRFRMIVVLHFGHPRSFYN